MEARVYRYEAGKRENMFWIMIISAIVLTQLNGILILHKLRKGLLFKNRG